MLLQIKRIVGTGFDYRELLGMIRSARVKIQLIVAEGEVSML